MGSLVSLPDGAHLLTIEIPGRPATKKTHQNVVMIKGSPRVLPSKQYMAYEKHCKPFLMSQSPDEPFDFGIGIEMRIWLDSYVIGDHCGYMQSLGDILETHGIVANDQWICWKNNEHWLAGIDKEHPKVELVITRMRHPKERRASA